jgi:hypothetical protein
MADTNRSYFTTRDLVFIGLIIAAERVIVLVAHIVGGPLAAALGLRITLFSALPVGILFAIALAKIKKAWTLSFFGIGIGIIAGFIMPAMPILFFACAGSGIFADIILKLFSMAPKNNKSIILGVGLYRFAISPIVLLQARLFDIPFFKLLSSVVLGFALLEGILGTTGAYLGLKIVKELRKAGVME